MNPFCVICGRRTIRNQSLISFTDATFEKCKCVLDIREQNCLSLNDVQLPKERTEIHMYHCACYRRFTALPPKYRSSRGTSNPSTSTAESVQFFSQTQASTLTAQR